MRHYIRGEDIRDRLARNSYVNADGCRISTYPRTRDGYAKITVTEEGRERTLPVHRLAWELEHGSIPDGRILDHTCHDPAMCTDAANCEHRACFDVTHLQLSTPRENLAPTRSYGNGRARWTHCSRGHEFTPENTRIQVNGRRSCLTCERARGQARRSGGA